MLLLPCERSSLNSVGQPRSDLRGMAELGCAAMENLKILLYGWVMRKLMLIERREVCLWNLTDVEQIGRFKSG